MRQTTKEKLYKVLEDKRLVYGQKELIQKWYRHVRIFNPEYTLLERVYTIREFGLFINKPFQEAKPEDIINYIEYKQKIVNKGSVDTYRLRIIGFFRWILKHTEFKVDNELAYPKPKIIKKKEISSQEKCERRIRALLSNTIICKHEKGDKKLSQEELQKKYPELLLKENNLKTLNNYYNYKITSGLIISNIGFISKLNFLKRFGLFLKDKTYKEATREDIQNFLQTIQQSNGNINASYKAHLLDFYRFVYDMFGNEQPRKYPDVVAWLYQKRKKINDRLLKAIIPDKEIKEMLKVCSQERDRAIISVLRDSSARVSELINLNIKDVKIKEIGSKTSKYTHSVATIILRGKTGERINQLFWSVSDLRLWLLNHPIKDDDNAPLFTAIKENRFGQRLTPVGINKILQKAARKAGIKRHIYAHLFRHTNLTKMAQVLSESELKIHAGWGANSKMAEIYIHLTADDVNNKILKSLGLEFEDKSIEKNTLSEVTICPNTVCSFQNAGDNKFCAKCGYPLNLKTAVDMRRIKEKEEKLHEEVMSKGTKEIDLYKMTNFREAMYQVLKSDPNLIAKLKDIVNDISQKGEYLKE